MKKLYNKNEVTFSIVWIILYVVFLSIADSVSESLGTAKLITAPLCILMTAFLFFWLKKNNLMGKYGLCKFEGSMKKYLFFFPLMILCSTNLWNGVTMNLSLLETVLYIVSMLCVGFLEELIFRGFLFRAMCKDNVKSAIIVSSITFGIGHIVNLLNGAELLSTLLQVCYAVAIGFLFTIIVYYGKSLIPCILCHGIVNSLSVFAVESDNLLGIITAIVIIVVSLTYTLWIIKTERTKKEPAI